MLGYLKCNPYDACFSMLKLAYKHWYILNSNMHQSSSHLNKFVFSAVWNQSKTTLHASLSMITADIPVGRASSSHSHLLWSLIETFCFFVFCTKLSTANISLHCHSLDYIAFPAVFTIICFQLLYGHTNAFNTSALPHAIVLEY